MVTIEMLHVIRSKNLFSRSLLLLWPSTSTNMYASRMPEQLPQMNSSHAQRTIIIKNHNFHRARGSDLLEKSKYVVTVARYSRERWKTWGINFPFYLATVRDALKIFNARNFMYFFVSVLEHTSLDDALFNSIFARHVGYKFSQTQVHMSAQIWCDYEITRSCCSFV